jgi:hypothetical protein
MKADKAIQGLIQKGHLIPTKTPKNHLPIQPFDQLLLPDDFLDAYFLVFRIAERGLRAHGLALSVNSPHKAMAETTLQLHGINLDPARKARHSLKYHGNQKIPDRIIATLHASLRQWNAWSQANQKEQHTLEI